MQSLKNRDNSNKEPRPKERFLRMINLSELARQLGTTPQHISMIVSGKRKGRKYQKAIYDAAKRFYKVA